MTKKSYNFYLSDEANGMIDASLVAADARSRSEFTEKAIRFYAASLSADMHKEMLSQELIKVIRDNIKNAENHIASTLFKMAGEQAALFLLVSDKVYDSATPDVIRAYHDEAYGIIRRYHGVFTFDEALENAIEFSRNREE